MKILGLDKNMVQVGNAIIVKKDVEDIIDIEDYESVISMSDMGHRGNFRIMNKRTGDAIRFHKGKRVDKK